MRHLLRYLHFCRAFLLFSIFISIPNSSTCQVSRHLIDSLHLVLSQHQQKDTVRIDLLAWLSIATAQVNPLESISYLKEALDIADKIKSNRDYGLWMMLGWAYMNIDDYPRSIDAFQSIFKISNPDSEEYGAALTFIGMNYKAQGDYEKALKYTLAGNVITEKIIAQGYTLKDPRNDVGNAWNIGEIYFKKNVLDTALLYGRRGIEILPTLPQFVQDQFGPVLTTLIGKVYLAQGIRDSAWKYLNQLEAFGGYIGEGSALYTIDNKITMAKWHIKFGSLDSALTYAAACLKQAKEISSFDMMYQSAEVMRKAAEKMNKYDLALKYNDLATAAKDSLLGVDKIKKSQAMHYDLQLKEQQVADLKKELGLKSRIKLISAGGLFSLLFVGLLFRNVQQRKKTITILNEQNTLIESQKMQLHNSLEELNEKQTQLIHAEKMASLGELTAGIAHEIQNPLNFVNNFSEINKELIYEFKQEVLKVKQDRDEVMIDLLNDMEANTSKIYLHGKRAESIVRAMLEHSQTKSGIKVDTNINALAEEFLKLSYHAVRAKEKNFNANLVTELDPSINTVKVIPADVGRVLINIFNNAFYSMNEKEKKLISKGFTDYHPILTVSTTSQNNKVLILIRDNGLGIPENIRSKIFQPFFTTKPTGNGTGLGLSLSYDIITKAHNGIINVDSREGEYCEFKVELPK